MDILYVSNVCSEKEYNELFKNTKKYVSQQSQKFNRLIAEGFSKNGCSVDVVSGRPVSGLQKQKIFKKKTENVNGVNYNYLGFLNFKYIRNIILIHKAKKFAKQWCKKHPNGIMFCDVLNLSVSTAVSKIFKKYKMKIITCVTDLPEDLMKDICGFRSKIFTDGFRRVCDRSTGYVLLSKYMIDSQNLKQLPFVVVEGLANNNVTESETIQKNKIVMYAGLLYKKYGVSTLLNGFIKSGIKDYELHFYGVGNTVNPDDDSLKEILDASRIYKNIKYCGSVSNDICVRREKESMLLVNPRPTNESFVKNSFPSKNIEYMSTGTPLLTTNLPSMPQDYGDYCYVVEDETEEGFANALKNILSKESDELQNMGDKSKEFILKYKNNVVQTKKIIEFINTL